jgi:hypothetical protein
MSALKLDEKTTIPLKWFGLLIASILSVGLPLVACVFHAAVWMKSVDDRLSAIEHYIGIPKYAGEPNQSAKGWE